MGGREVLGTLTQSSNSRLQVLPTTPLSLACTAQGVPLAAGAGPRWEPSSSTAHPGAWKEDGAQYKPTCRWVTWEGRRQVTSRASPSAGALVMYLGDSADRRRYVKPGNLLSASCLPRTFTPPRLNPSFPMVSERRKWLACSSGVSSLIFVMS